MGIISKVVMGAVSKSVINTLGEVTATTTCEIMNNVVKNKQATNTLPPKAKDQTIILKASAIDDLIGENYVKVQATLQSMVFSNITLLAKKDLRTGWLIRDGEVSEITVNGPSDLPRKAKYPLNTSIVIEYHTFKNNANTYIDNKTQQPYEVKNTEPSSMSFDDTVNTTSTIYCTECGSKQSSSSKFCSSCGHRLSE